MKPTATVAGRRERDGVTHMLVRVSLSFASLVTRRMRLASRVLGGLGGQAGLLKLDREMDRLAGLEHLLSRMMVLMAACRLQADPAQTSGVGCGGAHSRGESVAKAGVMAGGCDDRKSAGSDGKAERAPAQWSTGSAAAAVS